MRMRGREGLRALFAGALFVGTGCAWVEHVPLTKENDEEERGLRYFESSPYLLVHSDGKGGLVWRIVPLPDPTRLMTARPVQFFAKLESTMTFQNGVLVSSTDVADAAVVPKAIIAAAEKALPLLGVLKAEGTEDVVPAPHLYKIVVNGDQVTFVGGQGDPKTVQVDVPTEK